MEGGRPEDVSLLETGGGTPQLIAVQGGGGGDVTSPPPGHDPNQSLLETGGAQPELKAVEGGGLISWFSGTKESTSDLPADPNNLTEEDLNSMYGGLSITDKFKVLSKAGDSYASLMNTSAEPENKAQIFVSGIAANLTNLTYKSKGVDISRVTLLNPDLQDIVNYGTPEQRDVIRKKYEENNGVVDENFYKGVSEGLLNVRTGKAIFDSDKVITRMSESAKKKYEAKSGSYVYRSEHAINPIKGGTTQTEADSWCDSILAKNGGNKEEFFSDYTENVLRKAMISSENAKEGVRVAVIPKEVEQIVHIPSISDIYISPSKPMDVFRNVLNMLFDMNIVRFVPQGGNIICKVNGKVVVVFSNFLQDMKNMEEYQNVLMCILSMETSNDGRVFVLSGKNNTDLLCPRHVLYPYLLQNNITGLLISGDSEGFCNLNDWNAYDNTNGFCNKKSSGAELAKSSKIYYNNTFNPESNIFKYLYGNSDRKLDDTSDVFIGKSHPFFVVTNNILIHRSANTDEAVKEEDRTVYNYQKFLNTKYFKSYTFADHARFIRVLMDSKTFSSRGIEILHDMVFDLNNAENMNIIYTGFVINAVFDKLYKHQYYMARGFLPFDYELLMYIAETEPVLKATNPDKNNVKKYCVHFISYCLSYLYWFFKTVYISKGGAKAEGDSKFVYDFVEACANLVNTEGAQLKPLMDTANTLIGEIKRFISEKGLNTQVVEKNKIITKLDLAFAYIEYLFTDKSANTASAPATLLVGPGADATGATGATGAAGPAVAAAAAPAVPKFTRFIPDVAPPAVTDEVISNSSNGTPPTFAYSINDSLKLINTLYLRTPLTAEFEYRKKFFKPKAAVGGARRVKKGGKKKSKKQSGGTIPCDTGIKEGRLKQLGMFDKEQYNPRDITIYTISPDPDIEQSGNVCLEPFNPFLEGEGDEFISYGNDDDLVGTNDTQVITIGMKSYEIRKTKSIFNESPEINWGGNPKPPSGTANPVSAPYWIPLLTESEARLLNDMGLTPNNMDKIFNTRNAYYMKMNVVCKNLKSWRTAIPSFFKSLGDKCYDERLLMTHSKCLETKFLLYSIRDYLASHPAELDQEKKRADVVDPSVFSKDDLKTDTRISLKGAENITDKTMYVFGEDRKPTAQAVAINIETGKVTPFTFDTGVAQAEGDKVSAENVKLLNQKFENLKADYKNKYVLFLLDP